MSSLSVMKIIDEICEISKDETGAIARLPFSDSWMGAQMYLKTLFEKLGLYAFFDCAGNLHGRTGSSMGTVGDTIMTGSHVDTVKNAGKFDGLYGVVGGALAISRLCKRYGMPNKILEVIAFSEEEGSRFPYNFFGSKALIGDVEWDEVVILKDELGISIVEALLSKGFVFTPKCAKRSDIKAFVELHVEQGGMLAAHNMEIGVVAGIVGYRKFSIEIFGEANHAGTTPMCYRKDAGFCASQIISEIIKRARDSGNTLVSTIGQIEFQPNLTCVIPEYAKFSLDMRHSDKSALDRFQNEVINVIVDITTKEGTTFSFQEILNTAPVSMDKNIMDVIKKACISQRLAHMKIQSGAAHDSQILSRVTSVGMIFVPSKDGISHSPKEFTEATQLERGVSILEETLHKLAY